MTILEAIKHFMFPLLLIFGALASIGISVWQYRIHDNGIQFSNLLTGESITFNYACNHFPYNWMRPFKIKFAGDIEDAYCGYSEASTSYRLALACSTVIGAVLLILNHDTESSKLFQFWGIFSVSVLWYAATVADTIALIQGSRGCLESFQRYNDNMTCESASYGITVAVDVWMSFLVCLCWVYAGKATGDTKFGFPAESVPKVKVTLATEQEDSLDRF